MSSPSRPAPVAVVTSTIAMTVATFHRELLRQLVAAGYDVLVVTSPGDELVRLGRDAGVRTHGLAMTRDISPAADARGLLAWWRLLRRERPALVVTATPKASLLALAAARLLRVPRRLYYLGGLRLEGEQGPRRALLASLERLAGAAATEVVANSPSLRDRSLRLRLFAPDRLRTTHPGSSHGVDTDHFSPALPDPALLADLGLDPATPVIGFVGRLTHDKGVDTLVEALRDLTRTTPLQLLVVGPQDEPDSGAYLDLLRGAGFPVVTVGRVDDVRPYVALMHLHVLPSLREGFPNVVLETAAMGVTTVTTDATGCVDSVRDGSTGLVVPVGDAPALAAAVGALLADPVRRESLAAAARAWVVDDFRPAAVVASLLADATDAAVVAAARR